MNQNAFDEYVISLRRKFHQHPELSGKEKDTRAVICAELEKLGICFTPIDFKCPATGQSKTIWYSHVLPLLKNKNSYAAASPERQNIGI